MSIESKQPINNAVVLTRGIERVLRKLIRFLVGKISLVRLQEMIRFIYVEESERMVRQERPGRDVPLTRLAVLTGLDTRTLAKIRNDENYRQPMHEDVRFVRNTTPESCVLDLWTSSPDYLESSSKQPLKLKLSGEGRSFEKLVKQSVSARGITTKSILESLLQNNAVKFDESSSTVTVLERTLKPYKAGNAYGALEAGLGHVCSLIETVIFNFRAVGANSPTYFQQGRWTHRLSIQDRDEFFRALNEFLTIQLEEATKLIEPFEQESFEDQQKTAGVSFFYFEEGYSQEPHHS